MLLESTNYELPKSQCYQQFVELMGLEPTTPCLQSRCSSQLSYSPEIRRVYRVGDPPTWDKFISGIGAAGPMDTPWFGPPYTYGTDIGG